MYIQCLLDNLVGMLVSAINVCRLQAVSMGTGDTSRLHTSLHNATVVDRPRSLSVSVLRYRF